MTYFGRDIDSEDDPVKRTALETMIKTYGQTPRQACFQKNDPKRPEKKKKIFRQQIQNDQNSLIVP